MKHYICYPGKSAYYSGRKTLVFVDEKLTSAPYAQCGFVNIRSANGYDLKIFISYDTPIFAVINGEYVCRLWDGKTPTTSRQITWALRCIYQRDFLPIPCAGTYHKYSPFWSERIALNLQAGGVISIPDNIVKYLEQFSPVFVHLD